MQTGHVDLSYEAAVGRVEEHGKRVGVLAYALAGFLGYSEEVKTAMFAAGRWHDLGKLKIPIEILNKPGKLNTKEFEVMKSHSIHSEHMTHMMGLPESIRTAILHHHEDYCGTGYPYGLVEQDIPMGSRILRICDVFDALTEDRHYKASISYEEAIKIMDADNRAGKYDPYIYEVFRNNYKEVDNHVKESIGITSRSFCWIGRSDITSRENLTG